MRLELGAEAMGATGDWIRQYQPPPVDREGILRQAVEAACGSCPDRAGCREREQLGEAALFDPTPVQCSRPDRLEPELDRARRQLRYLHRDRQQHGEYRMALAQQYRFLEDYLRRLADTLPKSSTRNRICFRVEAAARSRSRDRANGDKCLAFPGPGSCYFLLLCDGMGTGTEAAGEGVKAAAHLRQLLEAGFSPEQVLSSFNSLLTLTGSGGSVTVDLARIHLDTGITELYKWGAVPSWVLDRSGMKKIGTATPPPGLSVEKVREKAEKLSLCRGEVLILLSDGVDGEDVCHRLSLTPDAPPGELAAEILESGAGESQDDATVVAVRLRPVRLGSS